MESCQEDSSWRVRCQLANNVPKIITSLVERKNAGFLGFAERTVLPIYARLLVDHEAEVRHNSAMRLTKVCQPMAENAALPEHLSSPLEALTHDAEVNVRLSFSKHLVALCNFFPRDAAQRILVPLMQSLAQDASYVVRRNVIQELHTLRDTGPNGILGLLVPTLQELAKFSKWRVRLAVIEKTAMLAQSLGQRMFERKLQNLIIVSLSDHVASIREEACVQAAKVVAMFGPRWAAERFFPPAFSIYDTQTNYLHRMTCLMLIGAVATELEAKSSDDSLETSCLPFLQQAFGDEVANVKLLASQTLQKLLPHLKPATVAETLPALNTLKVT
jgi:hypothetical protein